MRVTLARSTLPHLFTKLFHCALAQLRCVVKAACPKLPSKFLRSLSTEDLAASERSFERAALSHSPSSDGGHHLNLSSILKYNALSFLARKSTVYRGKLAHNKFAISSCLEAMQRRLSAVRNRGRSRCFAFCLQSRGIERGH